MKKILIYIWYYSLLLRIFIFEDKEQIQFLYNSGFLGTEEGKILRRIFRK